MSEFLVTDESVTTDDFRFIGHDFAKQYLECAKERQYSLYTLPCVGDPRYPMITVFFSHKPWTYEQLDQFSEGNLHALVERQRSGEGIIGFQYDLRALTKIVPLTPRAREFLPHVGV
jgi:hypothetical protein